jgi:hypothetical protein
LGDVENGEGDYSYCPCSSEASETAKNGSLTKVLRHQGSFSSCQLAGAYRLKEVIRLGFFLLQWKIWIENFFGHFFYFLGLRIYKIHN